MPISTVTNVGGEEVPHDQYRSQRAHQEHNVAPKEDQVELIYSHLLDLWKQQNPDATPDPQVLEQNARDLISRGFRVSLGNLMKPL